MAKRVWYGVLFILVIALLITAGASLAQDETPATQDLPADTTADAVQAPEETSDEAVVVEKASETPILDPEDNSPIAYVITFTNKVASLSTVNRITDTLPSGFTFEGMAAGSDVAEEPTIVGSQAIWQGPYNLPSHNSTLKMRYWVQPLREEGTYPNTIKAIINDTTLISATGVVTVPSEFVSLSKEASAQRVPQGGDITYDVTISNTTASDSILTFLTDTLPSGLSYVGMSATSEVTTVPTVTADTGQTLIVWTGPFTVPQQGKLHLAYEVRAEAQGTWTNSFVAREASGSLLGPAEAEVTVAKSKVFLPEVIRNYPEYIPPSEFLEEDFVEGWPEDWNAFVNWPDLSANQWDHVGDGETWGRMDFDVKEALETWALLMYEGEGAQEWTDVKIEATMRAGKEFSRPLACVWFRGSHELATDKKGGVVGGYMFCILPGRQNAIYLGFIDPNNRKLEMPGDQWVQGKWWKINVVEWYDITIEARGQHFKIYIGDTQVFGWQDEYNRWPKGTVGFAVYRGTASFDKIEVSPLEE